MTSVASIIKDAYRETNLIPLGVDVTDDQMTEAFGRLSTIVASALGNEAGENLYSFPLGNNEINSPSGYPWWNNQLPGNIFLPVNIRLMCNLTGEGTVNLHPKPHDGARLGVVDVSQNFDVNPLTIQGNGRSIEGEDVMTYDTPGLIKEWMFREDLGNWVVVNPLDVNGDMPWPAEFDDLWIIGLAYRLNPRYGQVIHPASQQAMQVAERKFSARYKQSDTKMPVEDALTYLTAYHRFLGRFSNNNFGDPGDFFNMGWPI